jgi:hypothetical protein
VNLPTRRAAADAATPRVGPYTLRLWIERILNGITQGVLGWLEMFFK